MKTLIQLNTLILLAVLMVISNRNPIHRIAAQIIVFTASAFCFMLYEFNFQGQTYIIVYVGAIAIQFQFVIMMVHIPSALVKKLNIDDIQNASIMKYQHKNIIISKNNKDLRSAYTTNLIIKYNNNKTLLNNRINTQSLPVFFKNVLIALIVIIILIIMVNVPIYLSYYDNISIPLDIFNYMNTTWTTFYKDITDIESQGIMVFGTFSLAIILISIALWVVMIGIISICIK